MPNDPFQPWLMRWRLTPDGTAFKTKFGSRLVPVLADGAPAMLKIAGNEEERRGGALMEWYAGMGAAQVLARGGDAILLERASGARSLSEMARVGEDDQATAILCQVAALLHAPRAAPPPSSLIPLDRWFGGLARAASAHGGTLAKADLAARNLLGDPRDVVVLHGDFHHDNVLDAGPRGWLAIDPKGLIGERGFEYANLFRNPNAALALAPGRMNRQVAVVVERAGLERIRVLKWILAYAGLGAAWSLESGHDADARAGLTIAEIAAAELALSLD